MRVAALRDIGVAAGYVLIQGIRFSIGDGDDLLVPDTSDDDLPAHAGDRRGERSRQARSSTNSITENASMGSEQDSVDGNGNGSSGNDDDDDVEHRGLL